MKQSLRLFVLGAFVSMTAGVGTMKLAHSATTEKLIARENVVDQRAIDELLAKLELADPQTDKRRNLEDQLSRLIVTKEVYELQEVDELEDKDNEGVGVTEETIAGPTAEPDSTATWLDRAKNINKIVDEFIVLGEKIVQVVKKGEPVRDLRGVEPLRVLPFKDTGSDLLLLKTEHWKPAKARSYRIAFQNLYGVNVVDFTFSIGLSYGGSYQGKGKYLAGLYLAPIGFLVRWGFNFDAQTELLEVTNLGSVDDPVAAATLGLKYDIYNMLNSRLRVDRFQVTGLGDIVYLGP